MGVLVHKSSLGLFFVENMNNTKRNCSKSLIFPEFQKFEKWQEVTAITVKSGLPKLRFLCQFSEFEQYKFVENKNRQKKVVCFHKVPWQQGSKFFFTYEIPSLTILAKYLNFSFKMFLTR